MPTNALDHTLKCTMPGAPKSSVSALSGPLIVIVKPPGAPLTEESFIFNASNGLDLMNKLLVHWRQSDKRSFYLVCDSECRPLGWININTGGFVMQDQVDWINANSGEVDDDMYVVMDD